MMLGSAAASPSVSGPTPAHPLRLVLAIALSSLCGVGSDAGGASLRERIGAEEVLIDLVPGPGSSFVGQVWANPELLLFRHGAESSPVGRLWRTDGTREGTFALPLDGIGDGSEPAGSGSGSVFAEGERGIYLRVLTSGQGHGCPTFPAELWFTDGSIEGTVRVGENVCLVPENGPLGVPRPWRLVLPSDRLVLRHLGALWATSPEADSLIRVLEPEYVEELHPAGEGALAVVRSALGANQLWTTDGTPHGTVLVVEGFGGYERYAGNDRAIYFVLNDTGPRSAGDLWVSDGTPLGTRATGARVPANVVGVGLAGDRLILMDGGSFYVSDTVEDAVAYADLPEDVVLPFGWGFGEGTLFWTASRALWSTDGTAAGTVRLTLPVASYFPLIGIAESFLLLGHPDYGGVLVSDGSPAGTAPLALCDGDPSCFPWPRRLGDGRFWFLIDDDELGEEPWVSDGTPAGTRMLADVCPGSCSSRAGGSRWPGANLLLLSGYIHGDQGTNPASLVGTFVLDEGTSELEALGEPFVPSVTPSRLSPTFVGNHLVFLGTAPETGEELHRITIAMPKVENRPGLPRSRP